MNQFKTKNFTKTSEFDKMKSDSNNQNMPDNSFKIPEEPNEQKRLKLLTGAYKLEKVDKNTLKNHANLPKKTPDDYHDINKLSVTEGARRIDEALGPKTDFSISNYENNYEKMNNEEKSMLTYKMQKEFNKLGYTDKYGQKLKEDGILGDKTKSAYENYIQKNRDMYNSVIENREQEKKNDFSILSDKNGKPVYFANNNASTDGLNLSAYKVMPYMAANEVRKNQTPQFTQPYKFKYELSQNNKDDKVIAENSKISDIKENEDIKLNSQDKKKVDSLIYMFNLSNSISEKEALRKAVVAIRKKDEYKGMYVNSQNGVYIDNYKYQTGNGLTAEVVVMSEGYAWLEGGENKKNDLIMNAISSSGDIYDLFKMFFPKEKLGEFNSISIFDFFGKLEKLSVLKNSEYYEKAKILKEGDIMVRISGTDPKTNQKVDHKMFFREKHGGLYKILENK